MSDVLTDNYFTLIFFYKKTKIKFLTKQQINATIIALSRAWPDHAQQAGTCFLFLSLLPPIPNAMWSRAGTSVRTCTDLSTMDFSAGHCPDALITLCYNLNLNTPLLTQGQCSWGNPSNVTQDDILMSLKCRYFKFLIFLTLTIIRLCPKKKKSSQISHISRNGNKS